MKVVGEFFLFDGEGVTHGGKFKVLAPVVMHCNFGPLDLTQALDGAANKSRGGHVLRDWDSGRLGGFDGLCRGTVKGDLVLAVCKFESVKVVDRGDGGAPARDGRDGLMVCAWAGAGRGGIHGRLLIKLSKIRVVIPTLNRVGTLVVEHDWRYVQAGSHHVGVVVCRVLEEQCVDLWHRAAALCRTGKRCVSWRSRAARAANAEAGGSLVVGRVFVQEFLLRSLVSL